MNQDIKPATLKIFTLAAALLGLLLRFLLYATAVDYKGLIADGHWATFGLTGLTLLLLAALVLLTRNPTAEMGYEDSFTPSLLRGLGSLAAAGGLLLQSVQRLGMTERLERIGLIFGITAGIGLIVAGICRFLGKKPPFLCHSVLSIYFALRTVGLYRSWSSDPQLMDYAFYLLALICLMLSAYFLAQFHVEPKSHRPLWISAMAAVFFCLVAVPESGDALFLLTMALWAFTCTPQMELKVRRQRPAMEMDEEA